MSDTWITATGFNWGPSEITRVCHQPGRGYTIQVKAPGGAIQVYVSEQGNAVRAWKGDDEMKVVASS